MRSDDFQVSAELLMTENALPLTDDGWLVGCFGFNGPLRQYFSLYRAFPKEREKEKRKDR